MNVKFMEKIDCINGAAGGEDMAAQRNRRS